MNAWSPRPSPPVHHATARKALLWTGASPAGRVDETVDNAGALPTALAHTLAPLAHKPHRTNHQGVSKNNTAHPFAAELPPPTVQFNNLRPTQIDPNIAHGLVHPHPFRLTSVWD